MARGKMVDGVGGTETGRPGWGVDSYYIPGPSWYAS